VVAPTANITRSEDRYWVPVTYRLADGRTVALHESYLLLWEAKARRATAKTTPAHPTFARVGDDGRIHGWVINAFELT
jgi:hypothetical protein